MQSPRQIMVPKLKRNEMDISTIFQKHLPRKTYEGWVGFAGQAKWIETKKLDSDRHMTQIPMCTWPPAVGKKSYFHLLILQPAENSSQAADFICLIFVDACKAVEGWAIKQAFTSFAKNTNAVFNNFQKMQSCVWGWSVCWMFM